MARLTSSFDSSAASPARSTMQDVAARAGVSPKTVSNVVNGYQHIRPDTRERVLAAMAELNYRTNQSARNLASGRTGLVTLAVPWLSNPYFADLAGQVIRAARRESVTVLIDETRSERARERELISGLGGTNLMDGVIISPQGITADDLDALNPNQPLVLLGERIFDGPVDHVAADNGAAARELTEHLISGSRRRIATVGFSGTDLTGTPYLRKAGIEKALTEAGLPVIEELHLPVTGFQRADGLAAADLLMRLAEPPDAIICFNDVVAIGALKGLSARSVAVPADVAVAGFDNIIDCEYTIPGLTTVDWHNERLANTAIELLLERLDSRRQLRAREVQTGHQLIVRGSTERPPTRERPSIHPAAEHSNTH